MNCRWREKKETVEMPVDVLGDDETVGIHICG